MFPYTAWAGSLRDWQGPAENERPTSYIIVLGDPAIAEKFDTDAGMMCQSMLLTAVEKGFGGCMLGSIDRERIRKSFHIDERFIIRYVIGLGKPSEKVVIEDMRGGDKQYYRDEEDVHHVPKRLLKDLIVDEL
jgi:nitroreductase